MGVRVSSANSLAVEDLGSAAQRDRRKRILDATIALASQGGFDAVQMRAVAEQADVALGTLYRYFPSKIHLLVSALQREFERTETALRDKPIDGDTVAERVINVLKRTTRGMQSDPQLTEALTRAFMFADASVRAEIHQVGMLLTSMLTRAMHPEGQRPAHRGGRRDRPGDRRRLALRARRLGHRPHHRRRDRPADRGRGQAAAARLELPVPDVVDGID